MSNTNKEAVGLILALELASLTSKLVFQLCRARYFTKLNVHWGFNNICIKPRDK